jgi:hypothetical protein
MDKPISIKSESKVADSFQAYRVHVGVDPGKKAEQLFKASD